MTSIRVCVIDDDVSVQRALRRLLQCAGYDVLICSSAIEFLSMPHSPRPVCAIVDVRMPGMTGIELQAALSGTRLDLPMIMISGHADGATMARALSAGATAFLSKPFEDQALLDAVELALQRHRQMHTASVPAPVAIKG